MTAHSSTTDNLIQFPGNPPSEPLKFLRLLDPDAQHFTFRTFDETRYRESPRLTRVLRNSLHRVVSHLDLLNESGASVFVNINKTRNWGNRPDAIVGVRAIMLRVTRPALKFAMACDHPPLVAVETAAEKFECIWRFRAVMEDPFWGIRKELEARFFLQQDPDPAAVVRLPGYINWDAKGFRVRIVQP